MFIGSTFLEWLTKRTSPNDVLEAVLLSLDNTSSENLDF